MNNLATATATVTIGAVDDTPPVANPDTATVAEGETTPDYAVRLGATGLGAGQSVTFTLDSASGTATQHSVVVSPSSTVGAWPAGVTVNSSTGAISGTPTTAGTYASLQVRRTDSGALTATSNSFTITVAAAGGVTYLIGHLLGVSLG